MADDPIRIELEKHVATVTIDRPQVRNALNRHAYAELQRAFEQMQADPEVRCIVLTGADPAFCSGDDVKEIMLGEGERSPLDRIRNVRPQPTPAALAVLGCDKPVLAAVNGPAVGWGMDLTLFCDLRIASRNARFGEIFVRRGLIPDLGGLWRLPRIVGPSRAAELLFTGDVIDAATALDIGLVSRVVEHDLLLDTCRELARRIAANAPLAIRYIKEGLRRSEIGDPLSLGSWITGTLGLLFTTEDHREGALSFVEKRDPVFVGR